MMQDVTLILPDMIFENHPLLKKQHTVVLAEEYLYFKVQAFHRQRLVLLRASMKFYEDFLTKKGFTVVYIESEHLKNRGDLFHILAKKGVKKIHLLEFTDQWLSIDVEEAKKKLGLHFDISPSEMFYCSSEEIKAFFNKKKLSMAKFYTYQRNKLNILMDGSSPKGGKYSFDTENRKKVPKGIKIPQKFIPLENPYVKEAQEYVNKHFKNAYGHKGPFLYPCTFSDAKKALSDFIHNRLLQFGDYEDAIKDDESFLFHSVLSPMINIGLITPKHVVDEVIKAYEELDLPLNSIEGFVRQVIGWREYMRSAYLIIGNFERTNNYFTSSCNWRL